MTQNWTCPRCKAFNSPRRSICWRCKNSRPIRSPHSSTIINTLPRALRFGIAAGVLLGCGLLLFVLLPSSPLRKLIADHSSTTRLISASQGGSVEIAGDIRVDVPAGALASDAQISISTPRQLGKDLNLPKNMDFLIREIESGGVALNHPVRLTFSYADLQLQDSLAPDAVFIAHWNGEDWEYLGGTIDPDHKTVMVEINHLSTFGVFGLPPLEELFSNLKSFLSTCVPDETLNPELTQLVALIGNANTQEVSIPQANVYLRENFFNFSAFPGGYVLGDVAWLEQEAEWLPVDKRYLLLEPILAHELSHIVQGSTNVEVTSLVLKEAAGKISVNDFMREYGASLQSLVVAVARGNCRAASDSINALILKLPLLALQQVLDKNTCARLQQSELTADEDGVRWAGRYRGETNEIALVFSHWFQRQDDAGDASCTHPSGSMRAQSIRDGFDMGSTGGIVGRVLGSDNNPLSGATITIDDQITEQTDENGQFLVTGLSAGTHTITYSKSGYEPVTNSVEVPSQDLIETSIPPLSVLAPLDRKDMSSVLQWIQYALKEKDISVFEQLTSDEMSGYFNYIEGGQPATKQEFLSDLSERLPGNPSCDSYSTDSGTLQIWTSGWAPAWEMDHYCYQDCWELSPPWTSNTAAFLLNETEAGWSINAVWLNDASVWGYGNQVQMISCDTNAPPQNGLDLGSIDRTDVNSVLQWVKYGLEHRDVRVFESLAADQTYHHTGGFSNFALSTEGWHPKSELVMMSLFNTDEPVRCDGYVLREYVPENSREPQYSKSPVISLTIYFDNLEFIVFTNGLSPGNELYLTEEGWFHPDTVSAGYGPPEDRTPCP